MQQRLQRAVQDVGTCALFRQAAILVQPDARTGQGPMEFIGVSHQIGDRHPAPDQQPRVETAVGHGLRRNELPAGQVRLHDLEPGSHPVQGVEQVVQAGTSARCGPEAEDRLGRRATRPRTVRLARGRGRTGNARALSRRSLEARTARAHGPIQQRQAFDAGLAVHALQPPTPVAAEVADERRLRDQF